MHKNVLMTFFLIKQLTAVDGPNPYHVKTLLLFYFFYLRVNFDNSSHAGASFTCYRILNRLGPYGRHTARGGSFLSEVL